MTIATSPMSMIDVQLPRRKVSRKSRIASITMDLTPAWMRRSASMIPKSPGDPAGAHRIPRSLSGSALGVLRCLARALEAVLLALLGPRITGQQACVSECRPRVRVRAEERASDAVADGPGLARDAAAGDEHAGRVAALGLGHAEGKQDGALGRRAAEVLGGGLAVDDDAPVTGQQADTRDGGLAPSSAVDVVRAHGSSSLLQLDGRGPLSLVRMIRAAIDLQLLEHRPAEAVLRQHALHSALDHELGLALQEGAEGLLAQPTRIIRVAEVALLPQLVTGDPDLARVEDDHVVARIEVRRVDRLVLALQQGGDARRQPAEGLAGGIDDPPAALDLARLDGVGLHVPCSPVMSWCDCRAPPSPA